MQTRFPAFQLLEETDGALMWVGPVQPIAGSEFIVAVVYPPDFPYHAPTLWALRPTLKPGAPHVYMDGSLCIHANSWDPDRGTAASCVGLVSIWLLAYLHWCETGVSY